MRASSFLCIPQEPLSPLCLRLYGLVPFCKDLYSRSTADTDSHNFWIFFASQIPHALREMSGTKMLRGDFLTAVHVLGRHNTAAQIADDRI